MGNKYQKQLGMIIDFLKPLTKDLKEGESICVHLRDYCHLSINGGIGADVKAANTNPQLKYYRYWNEYTKWSIYEDGKVSQYFNPIRDLDDYFAEPLVLEWKRYKELILSKHAEIIAERLEKERKLAEFEI